VFFSDNQIWHIKDAKQNIAKIAKKRKEKIL